jgi:hypothetical protein
MAVRAVNGEVKSIQMFPQEDGSVQVQVRVNLEPNVYHVVTVEREQVGSASRWLFLDEEDRVLQEVVIPPPEGEDTAVPEEAVEETKAE